VIDESMQGILFAMSFEPQMYVEFRMIGSEIRDAGKFAAGLKKQLDGLPETIETGMLNTTIHPYWRVFALRFPQMLRSLNKYGRFGIEDGQVVANAYLPSEAIGNLAVASWMTLKDSGSAQSTAVATKPSVKPASKSMDEILEAKISIAFDQESLETALQSIATEVSESILGGSKISMAINGGAFKIEGVTQNQQIRNFQKSSVSLRDVLTDLVRRANPVTTVASPTEKNQKVVWVVLDDPTSVTKKKIELTTRVWSDSNSISLPKEFVAE